MTWRNENLFSDSFSFFACTLLKCLQRYIKKGKCAFFALCESISNISQAIAMIWHTKCMSMIHIHHVCFCPCLNLPWWFSVGSSTLPRGACSPWNIRPYYAVFLSLIESPNRKTSTVKFPLDNSIQIQMCSVTDSKFSVVSLFFWIRFPWNRIWRDRSPKNSTEFLYWISQNSSIVYSPSCCFFTLWNTKGKIQNNSLVAIF